MMTDDLRFDVRLVERMLASGRLSREEYQKHLDSLPDLSPQVEVVDPGTEATGALSDAGTSSSKKRSKKM